MKQTLLLNGDWNPLLTISWKKAIQLFFLQKVVILRSYEEEIRSPSISMMKPAVVVLKKYYKKINRGCPKLNIPTLLIRDEYSCSYCGKFIDEDTATRDHIIPMDYFRTGKAVGSHTVWSNIVAACHPCNKKKANRTPDEAGMKLLKKPTIPSDFDDLYKNPPPEWADYIVHRKTRKSVSF